MKNLISHKEGFSSYNLQLLNDRQRKSLFENFDKDNILHIGISSDRKDIKILLSNGDLFKIKFSMIRIKSIKRLTKTNI